MAASTAATKIAAAKPIVVKRLANRAAAVKFKPGQSAVPVDEPDSTNGSPCANGRAVGVFGEEAGDCRLEAGVLKREAKKKEARRKEFTFTAFLAFHFSFLVIPAPFSLSPFPLFILHFAF